MICFPHSPLTTDHTSARNDVKAAEEKKFMTTLTLSLSLSIYVLVFFLPFLVVERTLRGRVFRDEKTPPSGCAPSLFSPDLFRLVLFSLRLLLSRIFFSTLVTGSLRVPKGPKEKKEMKKSRRVLRLSSGGENTILFLTLFFKRKKKDGSNVKSSPLETLWKGQGALFLSS